MRERFGLAVEKGFRAVKLEEWPGGFGRVNLKRDVEVTRDITDIKALQGEKRLL